MQEKRAGRLQFFLRTGFLRNIMAVSVCIAVVFPVISRYLIYPQFADIVIAHAEDEAVRMANYLATGLSTGPDGITKNSLSITYASEADEIKKVFRLAKYKVFTATGMAVFSTDSKDIGVLNTKAYFHNVVAKGDVYTKLVRKNTKTLENQPISQDVIETYVPILADGRFLGAFEIYYDITARLAKMDRLLFVSSVLLIAVAIGLLAAVGWTVNGALTATLERDHAEATLRKNQARFRDFAEAASDWFWEMDKDLHWSFFSDRFLQVSGLNPQSLLGKGFAESGLIVEDIAQYEALVTTLETHQSFRNFEHQSFQPGGRVVYLSISANPVFAADGTFEGYRGSGSDITETKKVGVAKDQFVSTVSHELRTPLTSINGALGLLSQGALGGLSSEGRNMITIAQKNCSQLINLVSDLLDLEKLNHQALTFQFETLDMSKLAREVVANNAGLASEFGVHIVVSDLATEAMVNGDSNRLTQVLDNLLSNAAKFSKPGGQITVSVAPQGTEILVSVTDVGKGISETFKESAFERFTQEDSSDTREKGGTGLGLNISKSIVEKHLGEIWFETEKDIGTTFFFTLPRLSQDAPQPSVQAA